MKFGIVLPRGPIFIELLKEIPVVFKSRISAYCLMTNHYDFENGNRDERISLLKFLRYAQTPLSRSGSPVSSFFSLLLKIMSPLTAFYCDTIETAVDQSARREHHHNIVRLNINLHTMKNFLYSVHQKASSYQLNSAVKKFGRTYPFDPSYTFRNHAEYELGLRLGEMLDVDIKPLVRP